jgi:single-stranded DNA-binding protein
VGRQPAKGVYVEVEGELRYREFTPAESDRRLPVAEIYASSILLLDRSDRQLASDAADPEFADEQSAGHGRHRCSAPFNPSLLNVLSPAGTK